MRYRHLAVNDQKCAAERMILLRPVRGTFRSACVSVSSASNVTPNEPDVI